MVRAMPEAREKGISLDLVPAGPGWWSGRAVEQEGSGEYEHFKAEAEWYPVLAWTTDKWGNVYGVAPARAGYICVPDQAGYYWHESEGEERKAQLLSQMIEDGAVDYLRGA